MITSNPSRFVDVKRRMSHCNPTVSKMNVRDPTCSLRCYVCQSCLHPVVNDVLQNHPKAQQTTEHTKTRVDYVKQNTRGVMME
jgi:hypothetical protein